MAIDISKLSNSVFRDERQRLDISKMPQYDRNFYKDGYPEQEIRNKIPRIYAWGCCDSEVNYKDKSFKYVIAINADETKEVLVKYEDICKILGWKSFKFSKDGLRIIPEQAA